VAAATGTQASGASKAQSVAPLATQASIGITESHTGARRAISRKPSVAIAVGSGMKPNT
jgi:hypothetical protein